MKTEPTDEISVARKKRKRQRTRKRVIGICGVFALFLILYVIISSFSLSFAYDVQDWFANALRFGTFPNDMSKGTFVTAVTDKKTLAVLTGTDLSVMKAGGAELMQVSHGVANPCLDIGDNRLLVYSSYGKTYHVYNRVRLIESGTCEDQIISGAVSSRGKFLLLTLDGEYSCALRVFNRNCSERFTWYGSEGFPLSVWTAAGSDRAAVVCVKVEDGKTVSVITVLDLSQNRELGVFRVDGLALRCLLRSDKVITVTDSGILLTDYSGGRSADYDFGSYQLLSVADCGSGNFAVALGDNDRPGINRIVLLSGKLNPAAEIEFGRSIDSLSVSGDRMMVLSGIELYCWSSSGTGRGRYAAEEGTVAVVDIGGPIAVSGRSVYKPVKIKEENTNGSPVL